MELLGIISEELNEYRATHERLLASQGCLSTMQLSLHQQ
jgi:hypothetical protein